MKPIFDAARRCGVPKCKIERPLALIGFSCLAALTMAVYLGAQASAILAAGCALLFACSLICKRVRRGQWFPVVCFTAFASFLAFSVYHIAVLEPAEWMDGREAEVTGLICELPEAQYGKYYYTLSVESISLEGAPTVGRLRFSSREALSAAPYDRITCRLHFYLPAAGEGFSSRAYYASKGVPILAYLDQYTEPEIISTTEKPLYYYALLIRQKAEDALFAMLPDAEAGLLSGVLLGDKSGLSEETEAQFRAVGVSHLLAVSGMHMTVLITALMSLLLRLRLPRRLAAAGCMLAVAVFMAVTGFTPSVARSGIMYLIYLGAQLLRREPDSLSSLGAAVLLLCMMNPYASADIGLLLSFSATLGMILFSSRLQGWICTALRLSETRFGLLRRLLHSAASALSTTLSATALTLPITILAFGNVSLVAPLSNLLLLYPASLMLELSALAVLFFYLPVVGAVVAPVLAIPAGWLASYMIWVCRTLSTIPFSSVPAAYGYVKFWLAATAVLAAIVILVRGGKVLQRTSAVLSLVILLAGGVSFQLSRNGVTRLVIADTGDGLCAVLSENGEGAVIGCGGMSSGTAEALLKEEQIRTLHSVSLLDAAYLEFQNALALVEQYSPGSFCFRADSYIDGYTENLLREKEGAVCYDLTDTTVLWDDNLIVSSVAGEGTAVLVHTRAADILFCGPGADVSVLPEKMTDAEILVFTEHPVGAGRLSPEYTLVSAYEDTAAACFQTVGENCGWLAATGGEGNLVVTITGEAYTIGRER